MKMCQKMLLLFCIFAFTSVAKSGPASFIQKCAAADKACLIRSTQLALPVYAAGIPELGIEPLEPLRHDTIDASAQGLKLILKDIAITGISDCQIVKASRDQPFTKMTLQALCTLNLDGHYDISGRLLILPIEGEGKIRVGLNKILINVDGNIVTKEGKDGKAHWDVKSWSHNYVLKEKANIQLENLFKGNEELGHAANELLKSSPNEIIDEVGPPIVKALLTKVIKSVDRFLRRVPVDELSID